ncbi:pyridoxamine 5'-phosphate oxidase family protein [Silvibacterium sp.]|uniref:pyridoxamine 5'-phosphate oxidase family protein n=1 Tax=Silvibacterium sp. TaxID=1964179 RepID=UPI0039E369BF
MTEPTPPPSPRTRVARLPKRGDYDKATIHAILDEAFLCHVGFVIEGQPFVIPTGFGREGDTLYIHGSAASRMLRNLDKGIEACITVTLLDGLVLARSAFNHSMNYRSVVMLGTATLVEGEEAKNHALRIISDQILKGRWDEVRPPTSQELKATTVLSFPIDEASAKIRTGPPHDDDEDYALDVWAGVLPFRTSVETPVADPLLKDGLGELPGSVRRVLWRK